VKLNQISSALKRNTFLYHSVPIASLALATLLSSPAAMAQEAESSEDLEVIEVRGLMGSLREAARIKRSNERIVDAIVAEDIGKLPDNNIAEALQRITGVSINTDFGVGESVSIRGLPQNRVELNGRSTVGDSRDGISLEDFPSSFLKTVEVIKSPTADMIEGALGGTVSLRTVRPLELDELTAAVSLDGEYADKTENWAPIFNASIGNNWDLGDAGTFGALIAVSYQDREIRQDEFFNRVRVYDEDVNGLTANTPSGRFAVREQNTVQQFVENRERTAVNLALQWAPKSNDGFIYLELSATERDGSQEGNSILDVGGSRTYNANTTQDANGQVNNYTLSNAFVIPKTWSQFRETESFSNALGGEWYLSDSVKVSGEIAVASSESSQPFSEFNLRPVNRTNWETWADQYDPAEWGDNRNSAFDSEGRGEFDVRHTIDAAFSQNGNRIPSIVYSDPQALLNPENLAVRAFYHDDVITENDETAIRFDVEYSDAFGLEFISKIKAGVRTTKRDYEFRQSRYRADNLYRHAFTDVGTDNERPFAVWIDQFEDLFPNTFETVNHANSFDQTGLSGQNDLLTYRTYRGDLLADAEGTFARIQQMLAGTNLATTGSLADNLTLNEDAFRDITEDTAALYLQAHLDFDKVTAVIGGRYVTTDIESTIFQDGELVTGEHDYSDFLPSLNVTYHWRDDTLIRFAAAKVMRRADFNELSPAFEISNDTTTASQGALQLEPFRATQFDLSIEHYFGDGNAVSFAIFYKDVESFLSQANTCVASSATATQNVTEWENVCLLNTAGVDNQDLVFSTQSDFADAPNADIAGFNFTVAQREAGLTGINTSRVTNGENGKVQGMELGYQQQFNFLPGAWSGLGVNANYTYADSEQPNGNALLDISKNTFNVQLFWEYAAFQVRLAYNYRDRFLDTEEERRVANVGGLALNSATNDEASELYDPTAGNNYRDSRGQLDFSASWNATDDITVVTSITNLTGEPSRFSTELGSPWLYTEADRRMSLGVRAKF